jgi:hypothetical protein
MQGSRRAMFATEQSRRRRGELRLVTVRKVESGERNSDCWPDWQGTMTDAETRAFAERNRSSVILGDIVRVLAVTGAIVALVKIALLVFNASTG